MIHGEHIWREGEGIEPRTMSDYPNLEGKSIIADSEQKQTTTRQ
jgi:hypothetical protein